jgi:hypothetical protein
MRTSPSIDLEKPESKNEASLERYDSNAIAFLAGG